MRDELNMMELADQYLRGELSATDRTAFEERMRTNPELRELVEDQRALLGGMERLVLRPMVNKAYRSYKLGKWLPGMGGAILVAILATGYFLMPSNEREHAIVVPAEAASELNVPADSIASGAAEPPEGVHADSVRPVRDTIIRTEVRVIRKSVPVADHPAIQEQAPDPGIITLRDPRTEEMPYYPGGFAAMHNFLRRNIQYPDTVLRKGGTVMVEFLVDVDGTIRDARVAKGIGKLFDQEALRVVRLMPNWNPAKEKGKPVKARIEVPIRFATVVMEKATRSGEMNRSAGSSPQKEN